MALWTSTFMSGTRHSDTSVEYILDTATWIGPSRETTGEDAREEGSAVERRHQATDEQRIARVEVGVSRPRKDAAEKLAHSLLAVLQPVAGGGEGGLDGAVVVLKRVEVAIGEPDQLRARSTLSRRQNGRHFRVVLEMNIAEDDRRRAGRSRSA